MSAAEKSGNDLQFEAAVAGAIRDYSPIKTEHGRAIILTEVMGIVNGTTNYILTKMTEKGMDYARCTCRSHRTWLCRGRPNG